MNMKMKLFKGLLMAFAGVFSVLSSAQTPGVTDKEIVIGLFAPLSGPLVSYGIDPLNAAKMIYEDVNSKGGINGRKIRLVIALSSVSAQTSGSDIV